MDKWRWSPTSTADAVCMADSSKLWQGLEQLSRCNINGVSPAAVRKSQQVGLHDCFWYFVHVFERYRLPERNRVRKITSCALFKPYSPVLH